ncbi:MAG: GTPase Era [Solirubrobacterales bacterium]|nr:GTPase Era [Solirubrobacterales bacterium]HMT03975.1 GTPase Era [Solirubrobacterales bacterium]
MPEFVGDGTRSGFIGLAGRPNVGKSTLVNAIVGARVAISSVRPQTTRRAIRGVATDLEAGTQLVLVDLPGVQRPRDELTTRMQKKVEGELAGADVALLVVNAEEGVGPGDRFIAETLLGARAEAGELPIICAVNKADRLGRNIVPVLVAASELAGVDEVFPVSALTGDGVPELASHLASIVPEGPYMYPPGNRSDQPRELLLAELIRGQALIRTREEIPHSVEVRVTRVDQREDGLWFVDAEIWVESDSQKRILIGKKGFKVGEIGSGARKDLEKELGGKVHLDLQVKVKRKWRRDEDMLDRLGID